jgi:hypothetical protein
MYLVIELKKNKQLHISDFDPNKCKKTSYRKNLHIRFA